jgi:uncharacterized protein
MNYQYIKKGEGVLYSVYHEPSTFKNDHIGVVLAYPFGQEYIRCHKMYVNLAKRLASEGFHVLRFDYSGTGDSSGDFKSVTLQESLCDIKLAINEIKVSCSVRKIILIGARLGGTLSLLYSKDNPIDGLVLLNPVCDGNKYLTDITDDYKKWLAGSFTKERINKKDGVLSHGFHYSSNLTKQIQSIKLEKNDFTTCIPTLLFDNELLPFDFKDNLNIDLYTTVNKEFWLKRSTEREKSIVPVYELSIIVDWMNKINKTENQI